MMWSERRPTSRSVHSSYTSNFQLLKLKNLQMRLNPEQSLSLSHKSNPSTPRYDKTPKTPSKKFRVHRQRKSQKQRTQSGKTVYEIYNIKGKSDIDSQSRNTESQLTSQIFSHKNRHSLLKSEREVQIPNMGIETPYSISAQNKKINFQQRKWDMNEAGKAVQCNIGSIRSQQFNRQTPLSPGKVQQQYKLEPILQQPQAMNQLLNDGQLQQDKKLTSNHDTHLKSDHKYRLSLQKQLIKKINSQTRYLKFRHNEKLKKSLQSSQSIFQSKQPSNNKIDKFTIKFGDSIENILRILHHQSCNIQDICIPITNKKNMNKNKIKITIQIPQFFYNCPDPYLQQQQLKFRGVNFMEEVGIIPSQVSDQAQIAIIRHPQSFMFQYPASQQVIQQINQEGIHKYCINWYKDDSVYMGQIQNNVREGVGMQWVPGVYVYYGQYKNNFRNGYGVIKYNNMKTYIGTWAYDHYHGYGKIISSNGQVTEAGTFRNSKLRSSSQFHELS